MLGLVGGGIRLIKKNIVFAALAPSTAVAVPLPLGWRLNGFVCNVGWLFMIIGIARHIA